ASWPVRLSPSIHGTVAFFKRPRWSYVVACSSRSMDAHLPEAPQLCVPATCAHAWTGRPRLSSCLVTTGPPALVLVTSTAHQSPLGPPFFLRAYERVVELPSGFSTSVRRPNP